MTQAYPRPGDIEYRINIGCDCPAETDEFDGFPILMDFRIGLTAHSWDDGRHRSVPVRAGRGEGFRINVGQAVSSGSFIVDRCDAHSGEAVDYLAAVMSLGRGYWKSSIFNQFGRELLDKDLLVITRIEIEPEHRGRRLGLHCLLRTMQVLGGGCGMALIKPRPLQGWLGGVQEVPKDRTARAEWYKAVRKLQRYWGTLGFEMINRSDFAAFPFHRRLPELNELKRGRTSAR